MNRFARWIVKHRVAVVIICLLMLIPSVLGMNATKVKYDLLYYLPEDLDTVKGQNILMEEFGKGAFSFIIVDGMEDKQVSALREKIEKVDNVDRAIYHLSQRGVKFDMDSKNVKDGKTVAIYFADEIAGFAFHLVQR